jgi:nicotinamide phosphoribosyltransferase
VRILPCLLIDGYKATHKFMYPADTTLVYSNLTPRMSRVLGTDAVVFFGMQYFVQEYLREQFDEGFFGQPLDRVMHAYRRRIEHYLGFGAIPSFDHIADLHKLGYLPLHIKAVPEATLVPLRVPVFTIRNTRSEFFWLTNMLETLLSNVLWGPTTSATTAFHYRRVFEAFARKTGGDVGFVKLQGHDFSFRGLAGVEAALLSGAAHLLSFIGTDTIPAIDFLEQYYGADCTIETIGTSIPATEHSVMSMGGAGHELETIKRLMTEVVPRGPLSIVADTWDFWTVVSVYLPALKDVILAREGGPVVVRPDSGDPVLIVCGDPKAPLLTQAHHGAVSALWRTFGGTRTATGHKQLDPHIGLIYGDSITPARQQEILTRLEAKGFASTNVVLGIGSYCVSRGTPILCTDLVWRQAGDLTPGQEILAFDENPVFGDSRHAARRYRQATIVSNDEAMKACYRVSTDLGSVVVASSDHPWLVWADNRSLENMYVFEVPPEQKRRFPRSAGLAWRSTGDLKPGDRLAFLCKPWVREESRAAGWLAGVFDGEGCLARSTMKEVRIPAWKINVSQNAGAVMNRLRCELQKRGFEFYENKRPCGQLVLTGGWIEVLRFLGTIAPERLMGKLPALIGEMPALIRDRTFRCATVTEMEFLGRRPVASIQTSGGTFITGGYLSHNTYQYVTRDTFGMAMKATYGERKGIGQAIFKDPKTDDGVKKSARGLLRVEQRRYADDADATGRSYLKLYEDQTWEQEGTGVLQTVFLDGQAHNLQTLAQLRARIEAQL